MTNCRSVSPRACKKSSKSVGMGANGEPCKTPKLRKTDVDTPHTNKCTLASVKMLASDMGRRSHDKMFPKPRTSGRLRTLKVVISLGTSSKNRQSTPMSPNGGSSKCGDAETGLEDANRLPTPPQARSKTTQEAPQKAAQTTAEDAKSVTA